MIKDQTLLKKKAIQLNVIKFMIFFNVSSVKTCNTKFAKAYTLLKIKLPFSVKFRIKFKIIEPNCLNKPPLLRPSMFFIILVIVFAFKLFKISRFVVRFFPAVSSPKLKKVLS